MIRAITRFPVFPLLLGTLLLAGALRAADAPTRFVADRPVHCLHLRLDLDVDVEKKHVEGSARLDLRVLHETSTITLDARDLEITAVRIERDGGTEAVEFTNDGEHLEVTLGKPIFAGQKVSLIVDYSVDDPERGLSFFGPSRDEPEVPFVVWAQGQSTNNSSWFPCFDIPAEKHTSEMVITTRPGYQVSSNGHLVSKQEEADRSIFHWSLEKPHSTYLPQIQREERGRVGRLRSACPLSDSRGT